MPAQLRNAIRPQLFLTQLSQLDSLPISTNSDRFSFLLPLFLTTNQQPKTKLPDRQLMDREGFTLKPHSITQKIPKKFSIAVKYFQYEFFFFVTFQILYFLLYCKLPQYSQLPQFSRSHSGSTFSSISTSGRSPSRQHMTKVMDSR